MARSIIRENHTLNPTPVWVAYSWLKPLRNLCRGGDRSNEEPLLNQEGESVSRKKKAKIEHEHLH